MNMKKIPLNIFYLQLLILIAQVVLLLLKLLYSSQEINQWNPI